MITRAMVQDRVDEMLGTRLNNDIFGASIEVLCPDLSGTTQIYSFVALVSKSKDMFLMNDSNNTDDNKTVKIFIKDIEVYQLAGKQIPNKGFKSLKARIKIDSVEYSIKSESIQNARRMLVFECKRTS